MLPFAARQYHTVSKTPITVVKDTHYRVDPQRLFSRECSEDRPDRSDDRVDFLLDKGSSECTQLFGVQVRRATGLYLTVGPSRNGTSRETFQQRFNSKPKGISSVLLRMWLLSSVSEKHRIRVLIVG